MTSPVILWLHQDLRLHDHPALCAAAESGRPVVPVYILDEDTPGPRAPASASRWWLHHSLASLSAALSEHGGQLVLRRGATASVLQTLIAETGAEALYFSRGYEPWRVAVEQTLRERLGEDGIEVRRFAGTLLFQPEHIRTGSDSPFKVFTPFWKACLAQPEPPAPAAIPDLSFCADEIPADSLDDWALLPTRPDWAGGLRENWRPGEDGAQAQLERFVDEAIEDYDTARDVPGRAGTSRLSPHLHFGELSPRQVWHYVRRTARAGAGAKAWLREVGWREFCYHLLFNWPHMPESAFRPEYDAFPWQDDESALRAWQRGQTGFPIVDAGMRELWHTGWMHNRVRMIVASLLVKHLLIPWQRGEQWFWDTLVDADLANNTAGWQWVAGCGADASPYFRIFNPILQGQKFDPDGVYVRRWVPELAELPDKYIHEPWAADDEILALAGLSLGKDYPQPIIEHSAGRQRALDALREFKENTA